MFNVSQFSFFIDECVNIFTNIGVLALLVFIFILFSNESLVVIIDFRKEMKELFLLLPANENNVTS